MCAVVVNYSVFVKELSEDPTDFPVLTLATSANLSPLKNL